MCFEFCNYTKTLLLSFLTSKLTNLINYSSEWQWAPSGWRPTLKEVSNIQCPFWRIFFFLQHLLKIRMIPSPVKHKQTKTAQQQIHSHLKKAEISRFPVLSNEAIQDLNSVAVNKYTKSSDLLNKTVGSLSTRTFKATPPSFERLRLGRGLLRMTYLGLPTLCCRRRRELSGLGGVVKVVSDLSES